MKRSNLIIRATGYELSQIPYLENHTDVELDPEETPHHINFTGMLNNVVFSLNSKSRAMRINSEYQLDNHNGMYSDLLYIKEIIQMDLIKIRKKEILNNNL